MTRKYTLTFEVDEYGAVQQFDLEIDGQPVMANGFGRDLPSLFLAVTAVIQDHKSEIEKY